MVSDVIGNKTEEAVQEFLRQLDENPSLGTKPIGGYEFNKNRISTVLDCNDEIARRLFSEPTPFLYDEFDQVYLEIDNEVGSKKERLYLTSDKSDPSFDVVCENIGKQLPEVPYDIECGGYPSRQSEAASLYKVAVVNSLQEGQYDTEIKEALNGYDFSR